MTHKISNDLDNFSVSDSKVCDVEECKQYLSSFTNAPFTVLTQNIRSIFKNFDNFCTLQQRLNVDCDFIVLTECWLSKQYNIPSMPGYNMYKSSTTYNQNDGIVVYARNQIDAIVEEPNISECNKILLKIGSDIAILALYRPPSFKNLNNFMNSLNNTLQTLSSFKTIILIGDININIAPDNVDSATQDYLNLCSFHGMFPAHSLPTHQSGSCLDHIMLKSYYQSLALVINSTITDHNAVLLSLNCKIPKSGNTRTITKLNINKLEEDLCNIDFDPVYFSADPQFCLLYVIESMQRAIQKNTTNRRLPNRYFNIKPWITPGLIRCMKHRDKLHMKAKLHPNNPVFQLTYKRYRNFCNNLLKNIKINYDKTKLETAGVDSKKIWKHIKSITYTSTNHDPSSSLLKTHASPLTSANYANNFFVNVGRCLAENAQSKSEYLTSSFSNNHNELTSFVLLDTDEEEVEKIIMSLKDNCAVGWDSISNKIIKQFRHILVKPLTHIFRICLSTGHFPKCLKKAVVVPIYKSGKKDQVTNYRPISLLPSLSKILEKIINNRLTKYLEDKLILSKMQFGFRPKVSTADAVCYLTDYLVENLDRGKHTIGIFLDLAKAFDTISIPILLRKLETLGIRDNQLKLFSSYLEDRSQCVKIGNFFSDDQNNTSFGIPQGSILGPTLFLIYINDLCNLQLNNGIVLSYADDTALLFSADSEADVHKFAQQGLNVVTNWLQQHLLTLNIDKTKYIKFSIRKQLSTQHIPQMYAHDCNFQLYNAKCHCPDIKLTNSIKYLGVILDENLSFKQHVIVLTNRLRKLIFVFKKIRYIADIKVVRQVYFALCQSILSYCICAWGGAGKTLLLLLERAQRAILKVATFRPFRFPTGQLYTSCNVLTVRQLFIMSTVIKQHMSLSYSTEHTNKRRRDIVCPLKSGTKHAFYTKFYAFLAPLLYNRLNGIVYIYPLNLFNCKQIVKDALQNMSYEDTERLLLVEI
jgi:hypothetical protein